MNVRYALSSTPYLREVRDIVLRIRKCFRFGQACRFTNFMHGGGAAGMAARASAGVAPAELEGTSRVTWWTVPDCAGASVCPAGRNRLWACMAARGSGSQQCHCS